MDLASKIQEFFDRKCVHSFNVFRIPKSTRVQQGFKTRFAWFSSSYLAVITGHMTYLGYGTAFGVIPREYQWILALANPFIRDIFKTVLLEVAYRSAGEGSRGKKSINYVITHYTTTKHAVFLAIMVGGVSTPATTYCLMAVDFVEAMYDGIKIVVKSKKGLASKSDLKGKFYNQVSTSFNFIRSLYNP